MALLGGRNLIMRSSPVAGSRSPVTQQGGLLPSTLGSRGHSKQRLSPYTRGWLHSVALVCVSLILYRTFNPSQHSLLSGSTAVQNDSVHRRGLGDATAVEPVLVSYSYFEKDSIQRSNMEFFMAVGMGMFSQLPAPANTDFVVVISGGLCTPCKALMPMLTPVPEADLMPAISAAWSKVRKGPRGAQQGLGLTIRARCGLFRHGGERSDALAGPLCGCSGWQRWCSGWFHDAPASHRPA
jgi:hypothetical protein